MGAKIGIIFAFLLSIAAAVGAYYLYQDLTQERGVRAAIEKKYDATKEKVLSLQSEKEQVKAAKEQYQTENEEYQRKIRTTEDQLGAVKSKISKLATERSELENQLKEKEDRLAEMETKVAELKKQAEEAMRACQVNPSDVQGVLTQDSLVFNSPETTTVTATMPAVTSASVGGSSQISATTTPAQALVASGSKVLTVNRKFNFVVVNMGSQDGLKMGDQLVVMKDGSDSATLQVEKLYDKFAAATIVNENSSNRVIEGDAVRRA